MNKLYMVGSVIIGFGVLCIYHAGIQDARKELADETWAEATHADDSTVGPMANVRVKHHRVDTASDSA